MNVKLNVKQSKSRETQKTSQSVELLNKTEFYKLVGRIILHAAKLARVAYIRYIFYECFSLFMFLVSIFSLNLWTELPFFYIKYMYANVRNLYTQGILIM